MLTIQRLNMDNSWLLTVGETTVLIDPWLLGSEIAYFSWFNKQWHRTKPVAVNSLPQFNFVLVTQKYADHFHIETLKAINPTKLIVPKAVLKTSQKLFPNATIFALENGLKQAFNSKVNVHFLPTNRKLDPIYDACILENGNYRIFLATHGFSLSPKWAKFAKQFAPFNLLITPFNHFKLPGFLGGDVAPGLQSVKALQHHLNAAKIVATHDENKHAKGLISKLAKITWAPKPKVLSSQAYFGDNYLHINHYNPVSV